MYLYINLTYFFIRNKQIGDLQVFNKSKISSYDSDDDSRFSPNINNISDLSPSNEQENKGGDDHTFLPSMTCFLKKDLVESKKIRVENDYKLKTWCTTSSNKYNSSHFKISNSPEPSIKSTDTTNVNDSFSSDNISDVNNTPQSLKKEDISAIRYFDRNYFKIT